MKLFEKKYTVSISIIIGCKIFCINLKTYTCKEILVTLKSASLPIQLHMMSSLKPKFINICHFTSHCFSNLCYSNNNIGWLVLSKQKCQQRHDEASYIKLSCQKLSNGNYDLFIYLFQLRVWVYLKKLIKCDIFVKHKIKY